MLIENARITAELEGRDTLLEEVRGDRNFLREEVVEARKLRGDVKALADRTLETLETLALGGKIERLNEAPKGQGDNPSPQSSYAVE